MLNIIAYNPNMGGTWQALKLPTNLAGVLPELNVTS